MLSRQSTREAMCGVRCWYLHQCYPHPVNGAGQRHLRVIMNHSEHAYQGSTAMNLSPANVRRAVLSSESAKTLP